MSPFANCGPGTNLKLILRELKWGESTSKDLQSVLGIGLRSVHSLLKSLREKNRIHICGWERSKRGHAIAVYRRGAGADAVFEPYPHADRSKRWRERQKRARREAGLNLVCQNSGERF
jgi:hypothetical protein